MKTFSLYWLGLAVAANLLCPQSVAQAAPRDYASDPVKPGMTLVKEWDFANKTTDLPALFSDFFTRYGYDLGRQDYLPGNGEWQRYRVNDNHRIEDGTLKLIARHRTLWSSGGFESGMLRSKLTQTYGYFEARIKMPKGKGLWPSLVLSPADGKWPPSIGIVTTVNNRPDALRTGYYLDSGKFTGPDSDSKLDQWGGYTTPADLSDGFHVYAVDWTDHGITHYVDGVPLVKRALAWKRDDGSDAGPAQLVLTLAVGGNWAGPPMEKSDFPAAMEISYIRVYNHLPPQIVAVPR
jgi:beta-glucanase (GH16 family)